MAHQTRVDQLQRLLERYETTSEFLQDLRDAILAIYAESEGEDLEDLDPCPEGFDHLFKAGEAFDAYEAELQAADEDEDEDEDDE